MALAEFSVQKVIYFFLLNCVLVSCSRLNVPRVLLPIFNDFPTNFTLEATEGGCYKWTSTRSDIIQLTVLNEDPDYQCSTKVVVSTVTKEAARNIAVVLGEEVNTKQMLRCDIIVDAIHELQITTTTKELFMEEAPEDFEVKAYDDQGNEFSTLEGIEFDWNIIPLGPNNDLVLRYITFRDSPYETPSAIEMLENENKKGYSILLEGVKSGSAKVSVRLPYPEYKHVAANEVQLMVVANLLITPAEVYVMPGDVVPFRIFYLNGGRMEEISLPDAQYYLEAENTEIASSLRKTGNVTALKEGNTRIVLRDRNVGKDDPVLKLPAANMHVVQPNYMILNVMPHKNWAILVGDNHDIVAEVYSSTDHRLFIGGSVQIDIQVSPEFQVSSRSYNGSWLTGFGIKSAIATVQASLESVYNEKTGKIKFDKPITARGELMIYPRITIVPSEVILPWDPLTRPKYDVDLVAKGGDGRFMWTSSDHSIGMVSQAGHVRTHSNGFFEVSAVMLRNHHNRQSAKFIILPPSRLEIVEFVMEAEVGSPVHLHIALYAEQERDGTTIQLPFTNCQDLPFHIKQSDVKFMHNKTAVLPPTAISCANIAMTALEVGVSKVTVTYYQDGKALEDSVTVSAYNPLKLLEPKRDIVLAVGTTVNLVYVGGPRPMFGRSSEHQRVIVSEDDDVVLATDTTQHYVLPAEDYSVVEVLCKQLGETEIKLMISNKPDVPNCKAHTSAVTTRITCAKPAKVALQPDLKLADGDSCPMDLSSGNVVVQSKGDIELDVGVYDAFGKRFLNATSLFFDWSLSHVAKGKLASRNGVFPKNFTVGNVPVAHKYYQVVTPTVDVGTLIVNVTIRGYKSKVLEKYSITEPPGTFSTIENGQTVLIGSTLSLHLVDEIIITPNHLMIFNHPGIKEIVTVKQGSGYFELALSSADIAMIKYVDTSKEIEIVPMKSGEMIVQVIDLCLVAKPAILTIEVVSVGIIRVEMADKVEVSKCITAIVRIYDENDNLMDIPKPDMIDVRPEFENKIANIHLKEKEPGEEWGIGEIHYIITGVEVGDTKVVFTVSGTDEDVSSSPMDLQVFQPLRLSPRNGSILVGSEIQLMAKGGPQPDTNIVFTVVTEKVADVNEKGVVHGKQVGTTKIKAQAIGIHPTTGQSVLYSEDTVELQVVILQSLKILSPLTRFRVGATVPFWVAGVPDIPPMILGSIQDPPIIFKWIADDKLIVDVTGIFHPLGVFTKRSDRLEVKVTGLQPGKTKLYVNATVPGACVGVQNVPSIMLSAFTEVEVIEEFALVRPTDLRGSSLLMAPFSELQLESNLDGSSAKIVYNLPGDKLGSTELLADKSVTSDVIVTVSPTGLLKSYDVLGYALLLITATDETGLKMTLSIVVRVKPIQYMNLAVKANWRIHANHLIRTVPLGTVFQLRATYHDNVGNLFHAGPKELKVRSNRCDLLQVKAANEDASVWIYTKKPGTTLIKAWAEGIQNTADYVVITTAQAVEPVLDHMTTGDVVCIWTPVVNEFNAPGSWRSSDSSLVSINPALDIAFAGRIEGVVTLTHTLLPAAPVNIQIYPTSEIEFLDDPNAILTTQEKNEVYRVVLVLQSEKSLGKKTNNLIQGWRCRTDVRKLMRPAGFKCFAEFSNHSLPLTIDTLYNISNSWVPETGQYACKLINTGVHNQEISVLRTNITLWATTDDDEVSSKRLNIKFLPGVYTEKELLLKNAFGEILVTGLPEVLQQITVLPADSSILYVDGGSIVDETTKKYKIQLIDYHWRLANLEEAMGIIITSPITQQHIRVLVKVSENLEKHLCSYGRSPIMNFLTNYKYAIVMAATMMIIFILTFYFYSNYMQPVVNVNVHPSRSPLSANLTTSSSQAPHRCAANFSMSPQQSRISPILNTSRNCSGNQSCRYNCSCQSREPIYGDASNFYSSPEIRRNRRQM